LSFEAKKDKKIYLYDVKKKEYNSRKLTELLTKHCSNLDDIFNSREETTKAMIKGRLNETLPRYIDLSV